MNDIDKLYAEIEALKARVVLLERGLRQVTPLYWCNPYIYSPPVLTPPTITVSPLTDLPPGNYFLGGSAGGHKAPAFRQLVDDSSERVTETILGTRTTGTETTSLPPTTGPTPKEVPPLHPSLAGQEIPKAEILATAEERWECPSLPPEEIAPKHTSSNTVLQRCTSPKKIEEEDYIESMNKNSLVNCSSASVVSLGEFKPAICTKPPAGYIHPTYWQEQ